MFGKKLKVKEKTIFLQVDLIKMFLTLGGCAHLLKPIAMTLYLLDVPIHEEAKRSSYSFRWQRIPYFSFMNLNFFKTINVKFVLVGKGN